MKTDIILSGVGGQGYPFLSPPLLEKPPKRRSVYEASGSTRYESTGGDVQSNLRLSDEPIASDLIPKGHADLIISLEPMESLRYLPYLKKEGWLVTNSRPFVNIPKLSGDRESERRVGQSSLTKVVLDVEEIAKEAGSVRAANIVMLGAAAHLSGSSMIRSRRESVRYSVVRARI